MRPESERLVAANPFPGLRSFEPDEWDRFFGRQEQIESLVRRLSQVQLIAVSGASGCGKSSLVKAGLINELKRRHELDDETEWRAVIMRPENHPIRNLAAALATGLVRSRLDADDKTVDADGLDPLQRRTASLYGQLRLGGLALVEVVRLAKLPPGTNVLVVVDQFEELFRFKRMYDPEEASAFVKLLLQAASDPTSGVSVVITLRSDALGACADFPGLPEAVSAGGYLVPRLSRNQRKQAIVGPAELRGAKVAPRLVQRLLNDVSDDYDDLPVMQHALSRTWRYWAADCGGNRAIDLEDYEAIGGGAKALSKHADEACKDLEPLDAPGGTVERVFKALTERVTGGIEARRPVELHELCAICNDGTPESDDKVIRVVERYRRSDTAFLVPRSDVSLERDSMIDISHESLIRNWEALRRWLDEEAESARQYQRLATTAALKAKGEEDWLGQPGLGVALAWRERQSPNEAWARRYGGDFVQAMDFLDDSNAKALKESAVRSRRRRIARTAVGAAFVAMFMGTEYWVVDDIWKGKELEEEVLTKLSRLEKRAEDEERVNDSQVYRMLRSGDLSAATDEIAKLKGVQALQAHETLRDVVDMKSRMIHDERYRLVDLELPKRGLGSIGSQEKTYGQADEAIQVASRECAPNVFNPKCNSIWRHPVHERIARKLKSGELLNENERCLLDSYKIMLRVVETPGNEYSDSADRTDSRCSENWVIRWELEEVLRGKRVGKPLRGKPESLELGHLAFSPDGKRLAAATEGGAVMLWEFGSKLEAYRGTVWSVAFSPDGKRLASANNDGSVILWDVANRESLITLERHGKTVRSAVFSPDGKALVTADDEGLVILWDMASLADRSDTTSPNALGAALAGHQGAVRSVAFSPDGKTLATASFDRTVMLWDVASRKKLDTLEGHQDKVRSVAFSHDGKTLASASYDGSVFLWDVATRERRGSPLKSHNNMVWSLAFSPDGETLASASSDKTVILWDVATRERKGEPLKGHQNEVRSIAFSPDGKTLASASSDKTVVLWDVEEHKKLGEFQEGHENEVRSVAFSPDGKTLASASDDQTIMLWNVASRRQLGEEELFGHFDEVKSVSFSPDGKVLASASADKTIILWDVASRTSLNTLEGHRNEVWGVAFSPDGETLASASSDKTVALWNVASGTRLTRLRGHRNTVRSVAFSLDGKTLVSASDDKTLILWDAESRTRLGTLRGHKSTVRTAAFSPDGKTLASASDDKTVMLWDVESRQAIGTLKGHDNWVWSVAFSPDGKTLASASDDKTVMLWDVATRERKGEPLKGYQALGASLAFSPDGKILATTGPALAAWNKQGGPDNPSDALAGDPRAPYRLMVKNAEQTTVSPMLSQVRQLMVEYASILFMLLVWPLWWLRRWWQKSRDIRIPPKRIAFRRAMASLFDLIIGVGLAALLGVMTFTTLEKMGWFSSDEELLTFGAAGLSALAYLLFCDAIRFKYCRSIGKILFDLRPVRDDAEDHGAIGLATSAKRNIPFVLALVFGLGFLMIYYAIFILLLAPVFEFLSESLLEPVFESLESVEEKFGGLSTNWQILLTELFWISLIIAFFWLFYSFDTIRNTTVRWFGARWSKRFFRPLLALIFPPSWFLYEGSRTLGDRWSKTQIIDADSEDSLRFELPPRYIHAGPPRLEAKLAS